MVDEEKDFFSIYKPIKGEKPLRDFFSGNLCYREKAAYEISKFFLWPNLPPLVIREGPFGLGSFQKFITHDPKENYFTLYDEYKVNLLFVAIFDFLILNTDRKAGSILVDNEKKIWSIDQALTFNPYTRFRTVMFEFNNHSIDTEILIKVSELLEKIENKKEIFKILLNSLRLYLTVFNMELNSDRLVTTKEISATKRSITKNLSFDFFTLHVTCIDPVSENISILIRLTLFFSS